MRKMEGFPHLLLIPSPLLRAKPVTLPAVRRTRYLVPCTPMYVYFSASDWRFLTVPRLVVTFPRFLCYISCSGVYMCSPMWRRLPSETWAYCCFTAAFAILRPSERQREHVEHYYCTTTGDSISTDAHYLTFWWRSAAMTAALPWTSVGVATGKGHGSWRFDGKCHSSCGHGTCRGSVHGKLRCTNHGNPRKSGANAMAISADVKPQQFTRPSAAIVTAILRYAAIATKIRGKEDTTSSSIPGILYSEGDTSDTRVYQ